MKLFKPDLRALSVADIPLDVLREDGVKGLLIDIDDTLVPDDGPATRLELPDRAIWSWLRTARSHFKIAIVSNTRSEARAAYLAEALYVPFVHLAYKPLPFGFQRALRALELKGSEVAVVGDRLISDVLGGKLLGARTVLVRPLSIDQPAQRRRLMRRVEHVILGGL